jgi:hypothetical protein
MASVIENKLGFSRYQLDSIFSHPKSMEKLWPLIRAAVGNAATIDKLKEDINNAFIEAFNNKDGLKLKTALNHLQNKMREILAEQIKEVEQSKSSRYEETNAKLKGGKKRRKSKKRNYYKKRRATKRR